MGLKFRRGTTAQKSGSLAFGEPYVNTTLGTLQVGGPDGDITLGSTGTGSTGNFGAISGSGLDITGNANIGGNLTLGGQLTIGDNTSDSVNVVASLSSSLIPQTTNVFDLGSATKIWRDLYISTGSIKFVAGTTVVKELNLATIAGLETATGSSASTGSNTFIGNQTITGSVIINKEFGGTALQITGGVDINNDVMYPVSIKNNLVVSGAVVLGNNSAYTIEVSGSLKTNQKATFASSYGGVILEVTGGVLIENGMLPVNISNNLVVSGSTILGTDSSDTISISGSLNTNQKATFANQYGTALEITGGVDINNDVMYPVSIKNNLVVTGSISGSNIVATTGIYGNIYSTNGVVSGSSQITYESISSIPSGIVSGSSQISLSSTTGGGTSDNVQFGSLGIGMAASGTSGRIDAANDVVAFSTSDIRLKENIKPIENALDKISKISGNTYDWKSELKDVHGYEGNDVGVIAQEVEAVLPQLVQDRDNGYKAVKYDKIVALLIEGIKEQQAQIHSLTLEIEKLKEQKGL